jgi:hypothetical protein
MDGYNAMKIDQPHAKLEPTGRVGAPAGQTPAKAPTPQGTDAVRLSTDLHLAEKAVRAAADPAADRPEVVSRAQETPASGVLGTDVERLADRMIDALIHSDDIPD